MKTIAYVLVLMGSVFPVYSKADIASTSCSRPDCSCTLKNTDGTVRCEGTEWNKQDNLSGSSGNYCKCGAAYGGQRNKTKVR